MSNIKTVYKINNLSNISKDITVDAIGQKAANAIDGYKRTRATKILKGFLINDEFVPVDLSTHWGKTASIPIKF